MMARTAEDGVDFGVDKVVFEHGYDFEGLGINLSAI
jgi:hypothetical protein